MAWLPRLSPVLEAEQPLAQSVLLADLSAKERRIVHSFMHERSYLPGEVIFDQGEEGQALYFVLRGCVVICHPGQGAQPIAEISSGGFFGELGLLDTWPRSAQALAADDCSLAVLFRGDFERLMESQARIASKISLQLARHLGLRLRDMVSRKQEPLL